MQLNSHFKAYVAPRGICLGGRSIRRQVMRLTARNTPSQGTYLRGWNMDLTD